jgi:phosphate transport system substrate-binding protein
VKFHSRRIATLGLAALFGVAGCTSAASQAPTGGAAGASGGGATSGTASGDAGEPLSGEIAISGSSTVLPISQGVQERFNEQHPDVAITVDGPGTGDGFELFCNGETDISDASRAIDEEEAQACADAGIEYVELKVAIDGLSILTSPNNAAVTCLGYADIYALVGPESEGFDNWSDAQPIATELGSTTQLPDAPLEVTGPGEESGTYDYFVEEVVGEFAESRGAEEQTRKDYNSSPNDNVIIQGIEGSDTSLGWVGYAYAVEAADQVKLLEVSAPDGECVAPTPETIASGDYPLARELFIYVNSARAEENPALAAYVDYYLADGTLTEVNAEVGYVDLAPDALTEQRSAWDDR